MQIQGLEQFPDGKSEIPATIVINKMGSSVIMDIKVSIILRENKDLEKNRFSAKIK